MRPINAHVPKINKAKAFKLVDTLRNGAQLTDDQLDQLYVYFSPARATASKCRDAFAWVALAVDVNDVRPYLHHVVARGGYIYGSDGHRCHRATTDLPDGRYCPATRAPVDFEGVNPPFDVFFNSAVASTPLHWCAKTSQTANAAPLLAFGFPAGWVCRKTIGETLARRHAAPSATVLSGVASSATMSLCAFVCREADPIAHFSNHSAR